MLLCKSTLSMYLESQVLYFSDIIKVNYFFSPTLMTMRLSCFLLQKKYLLN